MSGEIRLVAGQRLAEGDSVSLAVVNAMFSGMTGQVVAGSVGARELADGCITAAKLSDAVASELSIPDGSITTIKLADGCLSADDAGRGKMADGFVTADQLATDAVETAKITDGAVTAGKLAGGVDLDRLRNEQTDVDGAEGSRIQTTWTAVMSVAITPSATSSKVLVVLGACIGCVYRDMSPSVVEQNAFFKLTRQIGAGAETDLLVSTDAGSRVAATGGSRNGLHPGDSSFSRAMPAVHVPYLDSPATVSAVTYRLYVQESLTPGGGACLNMSSANPNDGTGRQPKSSLIVLEVIQA